MKYLLAFFLLVCVTQKTALAQSYGAITKNAVTITTASGTSAVTGSNSYTLGITGSLATIDGILVLTGTPTYAATSGTANISLDYEANTFATAMD